MNTENFEIQQLKKTWTKIGEGLRAPISSGGNSEDFNKKKTALERLRNKYRLFWTVALIMVFWAYIMFAKVVDLESPFNVCLGLSFAAYFLIVFCMDYWLWRGLGTIDPLRMPIAEVSAKSMFYRKRHLQFIAVLIPLAIAVLGFAVYVFSFEIYFLAGMFSGAVIGLVLGIVQFRRFMAEYRELSE